MSIALPASVKADPLVEQVAGQNRLKILSTMALTAVNGTKPFGGKWLY
jgi:hypothetical protein